MNFVVQTKIEKWHNVNSRAEISSVAARCRNEEKLQPMNFITAVAIFLYCRFVKKITKGKVVILRIADKENNRLTPRIFTPAWYERIRDKQGQPKRYVYKGWGIYIWKWAGAFFPQVTFSFGDLMKYSITLNNVFHNGRGIRIHFGDLILLNWAYTDQIGWWFEKNFQIAIFLTKRTEPKYGREWKYQWGFQHRKQTA